MGRQPAFLALWAELWCDNNNGGLLGRLIPGTEVKDLKVIIHSGKVVKGNMASGGIVADNMGTVTSCWASCDFTNASGSQIGGVASSNWESIIACYWQSDNVSNGVANFMGNSETIKIGEDIGWAEAVIAMNEKLEDWKWKYESSNDYPTIVRVSI